jgi:hypothetical protein
VVHDVATLVGQRVFGIALGHEDLIDHDRLRHDPVLGVVLDRLEARHGRCAPLAGKSTLNRLEHGGAEADRYRRIAHDGAGDCQEFRVRPGIVGSKEPRYAATQRTEDT